MTFKLVIDCDRCRATTDGIIKPDGWNDFSVEKRRIDLCPECSRLFGRWMELGREFTALRANETKGATTCF